MLVATRITKVTVHARGALVTREAELGELADGALDLEVEGVTPLCEPGSLRAALPGSGREILAVHSALAVPALPARVGEPLERLRAAELALARLEAEHARLGSHAAELAGLELKPYLRAPNATLAERAAETLATAAAAEEVLAGVHARLSALEAELEQARHARDAERLAADQATSAERMGQGHPTRRIVVRTAGSGAAPRLELTYVVWPARWWPLYVLRVTSGDAPRGTLLHEALVAQLGGEDWSGVELMLATSDLVYDARLPELASLRLGRAQPPARRGYRPAEPGLERMFAGHDRGAPPDLLPGAHEKRALEQHTTEKPRPAPPPAPEAAPYDVDDMVELSAQATPPPRKSGGLLAGIGGLFGGGGGGGGGVGAPASMPPMPASAPAGGRMMKTMSMSVDRRGGDGDDEAPEPEADAPAALEPSDAWLEFDALVMAGAGDRRRGRLLRAPQPAGGDGGARSRIESLAPPVSVQDPLISRGLFDHRYSAAGAAQVPSDGAPHRVSVGVAEAPCRVRYLSVPREAPEVYREAAFQNPFDAPLLAGPVDVVLDGTLLASADIPRIDRGGELAVGLGVEERIRVARNPRVREDTAGLLGGQTVVTHTVSVELRSALARPVSVELLDRVPVTDHDDVSIELVRESQPGEKYEQTERARPLRGGRRWRIELGAAGSATLETEYRVSLPSKMEVVGGNRRE